MHLWYMQVTQETCGMDTCHCSPPKLCLLTPTFPELLFVFIPYFGIFFLEHTQKRTFYYIFIVKTQFPRFI